MRAALHRTLISHKGGLVLSRGEPLKQRLALHIWIWGSSPALKLTHELTPTGVLQEVRLRTETHWHQWEHPGTSALRAVTNQALSPLSLPAALPLSQRIFPGLTEWHGGYGHRAPECQHDIWEPLKAQLSRMGNPGPGDNSVWWTQSWLDVHSQGHQRHRWATSTWRVVLAEQDFVGPSWVTVFTKMCGWREQVIHS